ADATVNFTLFLAINTTLFLYFMAPSYRAFLFCPIYKRGQMIKNLSFTRICKSLPDTICEIPDRIRDISVQCQVHLLRNLVVIILHSPPDPVEHNSHKAVFIKVRDKRLILLRNPGSRSFLLHDSADQ